MSHPKNHNKRWTEPHEQFLREALKLAPLPLVARILGRTHLACIVRGVECGAINEGNFPRIVREIYEDNREDLHEPPFAYLR